MRPSILVELESGDVCIFEGGIPERPEKNPRSKALTNNKQPAGWNPTRHTLVGGERSHHSVFLLFSL